MALLGSRLEKRKGEAEKQLTSRVEKQNAIDLDTLHHFTLPERELNNGQERITVPEISVASNYLTNEKEVILSEDQGRGLLTYGYSPLKVPANREKLSSKEGQAALTQVMDIPGLGRIVTIVRPADGKYHPPQDALGVLPAYVETPEGRREWRIAYGVFDGVTTRSATRDEFKKANDLIFVREAGEDVDVISDGDFFAHSAATVLGTAAFRVGTKNLADMMARQPILPEHIAKNPKGGTTSEFGLIRFPADDSWAMEIEHLGMGNKDNLSGGLHVYPAAVDGASGNAVFGRPHLTPYRNYTIAQSQKQELWEQDVNDQGIIVKKYTPKVFRTSTGTADQTPGHGFLHPSFQYDPYYAQRDYTTPEYQGWVEPLAYQAHYPQDNVTITQTGAVFAYQAPIRGAYTDRYPISPVVLGTDGAKLTSDHTNLLSQLTGDQSECATTAGSAHFVSQLIEQDRDDGSLIIFIPEHLLISEEEEEPINPVKEATLPQIGSNAGHEVTQERVEQLWTPQTEPYRRYTDLINEYQQLVAHTQQIENQISQFPIDTLTTELEQYENQLQVMTERLQLVRNRFALQQGLQAALFDTNHTVQTAAYSLTGDQFEQFKNDLELAGGTAQEIIQLMEQVAQKKDDRARHQAMTDQYDRQLTFINGAKKSMEKALMRSMMEGAHWADQHVPAIATRVETLVRKIVDSPESGDITKGFTQLYRIIQGDHRDLFANRANLNYVEIEKALNLMYEAGLISKAEVPGLGNIVSNLINIKTEAEMQRVLNTRAKTVRKLVNNNLLKGHEIGITHFIAIASMLSNRQTEPLTNELIVRRLYESTMDKSGQRLIMDVDRIEKLREGIRTLRNNLETILPYTE